MLIFVQTFTNDKPLHFYMCCYEVLKSLLKTLSAVRGIKHETVCRLSFLLRHAFFSLLFQRSENIFSSSKVKDLFLYFDCVCIAFCDKRF